MKNNFTLEEQEGKGEILNLTNEDFIILEKSMEELDELEKLKLKVDTDLAKNLSEISELEKELSMGSTSSLLEECKNSVLTQITSQFGLNVLFTNEKDGGNVTTVHNFEKGITSTDDDKKKYDDMQYNKENLSDVRKSAGYDTAEGKSFNKSRKEKFNSDEPITDYITGKELPKDGRSHVDHIVSAKEIETDAGNNLFLTQEERVKMATSKENLAFTDSSINQSKSDQKMKDFVDKKRKDGTTNAEHFEIDKKKALEQDKISRKNINKTVSVAQFKKQSTELLSTGLNDAKNSAITIAMGVIIKEFSEVIFKTAKEIRDFKGFKHSFIVFKEKLTEKMEQLKEKWKDILKDILGGGITSFFSNLLTFAINIFATTLKNVVAMIRAGFMSIVNAIKYLKNNPENLDQDELNFEASKLLVTGIIATVGLTLTTAIEAGLKTIPPLAPILSIPIPMFGTFGTLGNLLATTIGGVLGGLVSTIVVYFMDAWRSGGNKTKLEVQLLYKNGETVIIKAQQSWICLYESHQKLVTQTKEAIENIHQFEDRMDKHRLDSKKEFDSELEKTLKIIRGEI